MPQGFTAYPELGAREFLVYFLRLRGVARRDARTRAGVWLAAVGLDAAADARTGTFSQGMLQRLGLAYALSAGAALLVLDEPFAGVDPEGRAALTDLLFAAARDRVALVCTHHVEEMVERGAAVARVGEGALALDAAAVP
jgi:ABC-type multidrug transport system ATPase subunit